MRSENRANCRGGRRHGSRGTCRRDGRRRSHRQTYIEFIHTHAPSFLNGSS